MKRELEPNMPTDPSWCERFYVCITLLCMYGPEADGVAIAGRKNDDDDMWEWQG